MDASALDPERDSSPLSDVDETIANKRQSGRVRRKPDLFSSQGYSTSTKRKRPSTHGEDDEDASDSAAEPENDDEDQEEGDVDMSEDEADEEELKERRKAQRKAAKTKEKPAKAQRAAKKPKIANGATAELAFRPVANGQRAKRKKPRARPSGLVTNEEGLFGMLGPIALIISRIY